MSSKAFSECDGRGAEEEVDRPPRQEDSQPSKAIPQVERMIQGAIKSHTRDGAAMGCEIWKFRACWLPAFLAVQASPVGQHGRAPSRGRSFYRIRRQSKHVKAHLNFSRPEDDRRRIEEEEEERGRRGEWRESVCSLYHPFGQTAKSREGREENWLLSLDWEEVHACIHTHSALPRQE